MPDAFSLGRLKQERKLADLLPIESLRHVKELEVQNLYAVWDGPSDWQEWPMAWSQLTALTSLSCTLSHEYGQYPPLVLNRMTSLERLEIVHYNPDGNPDFVDEFYEGDCAWAYKVEILDKVSVGIQWLRRLKSLLIDGDERIGLLST